MKLGVDIIQLLEEDAVAAADLKPERDTLVDALVAATVARYDAFLWTKDLDFNQFLPEEKIENLLIFSVNLSSGQLCRVR